MKKHILAWSYRLGLASAVITLALRSVNAFGVWLPPVVTQGVTIWYMSFFKGALLFLLISIATSLYSLAQSITLLQRSENGFRPVPDEMERANYATVGSAFARTAR